MQLWPSGLSVLIVKLIFMFIAEGLDISICYLQLSIALSENGPFYGTYVKAGVFTSGLTDFDYPY